MGSLLLHWENRLVQVLGNLTSQCYTDEIFGHTAFPLCKKRTSAPDLTRQHSQQPLNLSGITTSRSCQSTVLCAPYGTWLNDIVCQFVTIDYHMLKCTSKFTFALLFLAEYIYEVYILVKRASRISRTFMWYNRQI